ncbi:MAG: ATP phosphoribosyltransferase regulatory subunit [Christensenellaceae bacterium]|jgi:ATP phosphoribosyltransferase regulatory subunit
MKQSNLQIPRGTTDFLPEECARKRYVENILMQEFLVNGYDEVKTPTFEYYDVFQHDSVPYVQENMIRFFDSEGRTLALRPDSTGPIARMAATRLLDKDTVLRLCYVQDAYGFFRQGIDKKSEFAQAGVELLGKKGADADAEVIALAVQAFRKTKLKDFSIEMGQVAFFKGIIEDCGLNDEQTEKIRMLVDAKNNVELEFELDQLQIDSRIKRILLQLGGLFGGREVFDKALFMAVNDRCVSAVENLREVYEILCDFGYEEYISIDLGMLNDFNYYTGIIFRGIVRGVGAPLLSGGRYDGLLAEFGADSPATGFAIGIKELLTALGKQEICPNSPEKTRVLRCTRKNRDAAHEYALRLRENGERVLLEMNGHKNYPEDKYTLETYDE